MRSSAPLAWRALAGLALIIAFAASRVALAQGDPLPPASIENAGSSALTSCAFGWSPNLDAPVGNSGIFRAVGIYFPANGRFYVMGGRGGETPGDSFPHPFEFNPNNSTWVTKAATYPDNQVSNMACGLLTVSGTPQIYCVGGNVAGASTATARVFSYNPVTDTITNLSSTDNWPANSAGNLVPGGFAVARNKLYLIGGYRLNVGDTAQTWQFDPTVAAGSRWLQRLNYPVARSYIPTGTVGGLIYTFGGTTTPDNINFSDTSQSYKYDPVANTWAAIASIPRTVSNTRAVAVSGEMWVLGGGLTLDQSLHEVDIYTPGTNSWRLGPPLLGGRRSFPADSNGASNIWVTGGYYELPSVTEIYEVLAFSESFDDVTAPALPPGWVATNAQGPAPLWATTTTDPYIGPNDAFVDDPPVISDKYLDSPDILITSAAATVSFRNYYRLESGFDGGVLEVSSPNINAGAFTDITSPAVGGSFVSFGYDTMIDTGSGNPLAGRKAWSGNSFNYGVGYHVPTFVNLGPNLAGQTIKLRFRMGSDIDSAGNGWQIDLLSVAEPACAPALLVTTAADHNDGACNAADCTLREAINAANARPGSIISFASGVTGTIQLASALPALINNTAVQGPGANLLTVRRNTGGAYRIFTVNPGAAVSFSGLTIANGDANGNSPNLGGGIYNDHGIVSLINCTISGNTAYSGGGIFSQGSSAGSASLAINNSTLSANSASGALGEGGAIYNQGLTGGIAFLDLTNCTVSGNTAVIGGAGILNFGAGGTTETTLTNCTFKGNAISNDSAALFLANTLLAASPGANLVNSNGTITSEGHNLSSDAAGGNGGTGPGGFLNGPGDKRNTNPQLDPAGLANNGGPTQTIALLSTSPARDAGNDSNAPATDQRNFIRVGLSDIGAFEFGGTQLTFNISGGISYCSNPVPGPVPNVTLTLTGSGSGVALSDGSGNYQFASLAAGGTYTVTPTKAARVPGSANINTQDVIATQRHFLGLGTPLSGCKLLAADVTGDTAVNTSDVIAIQRFFLGLSTGIANTGKYKFTPVSRTYTGLVTNQTGQNYDTLVLGDVAASFVELVDGALEK